MTAVVGDAIHSTMTQLGICYLIFVYFDPVVIKSWR